MNFSNNKYFTSNRFAITILFFFCLILVAIWFRDGKLLATGEDGLMLANPKRSLELYQYEWSELGPGVTSFALRTRLLLFYLASSISPIIGTWVFQAGLIFILLLSGTLSVYYLTKELISKRVTLKYIHLLAFISAVFYILNPISLLGIWYRFIYAFMFLFALAPLFFYLFIKGLHNKDIRFVFLTALITLPFSYAYGSPASAFLVWLLPSVYVLFTVFQNFSFSRPKLELFPIAYLGLLIVFWTTTNLWWILPYGELFGGTLEFTEQRNLQHNIGTLQANSKDFPLVNVIRLIHGGFLYRGEVFGPIYKNLFFVISSWVTPILAIVGLLVIHNRFLKRFFLISFIFLIFLSKGTSFPFGELFLWLFTNIPSMQLFRNPLEKFGPLLPIIYAPLFGIGVIWVASALKGKRFLKLAVLILIASSVILMHYPFFTEAIVTYGNRDIRVVVPSSFKQANDLLKGEEHRILNLPLMGGASGRYKWEHNYVGIESSEHLFFSPVIARVIFGNTFFDELIYGVSRGLADNNLIGIAQIFAADLVAFRKDTDVFAHGAYFDALERTDKMIKSSTLTNIFDSQEFSLWELPREKSVPLIFTPTSIFEVNSAEEVLGMLDKKSFNPQKEVFICKSKEGCNPLNPENRLVNLTINGTPKAVRVSKKSPTNYHIEIEESLGKFLLVFNNSYHPGWQIILDNTSVAPEEHLVINGFVNGYLINKKGNFPLELVFTPQDLYQKSIKFTYLSIFFGILATLLLSNPKIRKFCSLR